MQHAPAAVLALNALDWIGANWIVIFGIAFLIVFFYVFSAVMLDLPLPFEEKDRERNSSRRE